MTREYARLVYSTDAAIPRKERPQEEALLPAVSSTARRVTVRLDRKGRGGKSVTVIEGLQLQQSQQESLLKQLKAKLGTGGTIRETALEIQGNHCSLIMAELEKMGFRPKRAGG